MPLPAFAEVEELEAYLGITIAEGQDAHADSLLTGASTLVRSAGNENFVDEDGELEEDIPDPIGLVTVQCAARAWVNPEMAVIDTTGPFTTTRTREAAQGLYLTDDEIAMIQKVVAGEDAGSIPGLWVLGTTRGPLETGRGHRGRPAAFLDTIDNDGSNEGTYPWLNDGELY